MSLLSIIRIILNPKQANILNHHIIKAFIRNPTLAALNSIMKIKFTSIEDFAITALQRFQADKNA
jgi:hypothetical protein